MTRGQLLAIIRLMFEEGDGAIHAARPKHGSGVVQVEGGQASVIVADGHQLPTTGEDDERPVPGYIAHAIVAILNAAMDEPAPLLDALMTYDEWSKAHPPEGAHDD